MVRSFPLKGSFEKKVIGYSEKEFGGLGNFHIHGDRAYTRRDEFYAHAGISIADIASLSLPEKQRLTWVLHKGPAFYPECIEERMVRLVKESIAFGVTKLHTTVDVTYNTKFKSLEIAERLKEKYKKEIEIKIGAYNPSGFKVRGLDEERFELFEEAAKRADFLVALAEKDNSSGHMGDEQHNHYMARLSYALQKPVHYHVGQENRRTDNGMEKLLKNISYIQDEELREAHAKFPEQIAIHNISASCKSPDEFNRIVNEMEKRRVGLIVCPRAALSMKQDESCQSPIHNSIAKAWHFAIKGIPIRLGVDNLDDIYVPASSADVYDELEDFANALRGYPERILAKLLSGYKLDTFDKGTIKRDLGF